MASFSTPTHSQTTRRFTTLTAVLLAAAVSVTDVHADPAQAKVDFAREIQPLLEAACIRCHNEQEAEGGLRLDSREFAIKGGDRGPALVPGKPKESLLYAFMTLSPGDDEFMPPSEKPLDSLQLERFRLWIEQGAVWPEARMTPQPRIDFVRHIQPLLEMHCLGCHSEKDPEGELDLSTWAAATRPREHPTLTRFHVEKSRLVETVSMSKDADLLMPPADNDGPLEPGEVAKFSLWVAQGAVWPAEMKLKQRPKIEEWEKTADTIDLLEQIHRKIVATGADDLADYRGVAKRSEQSYEMVAIQGGEFMMGSSAKEKQRQEHEGPQVKVKVAPFWIGKYEVTWNQYEPFMTTQVSRAKNGARKDYDPKKHDLVDAVSQPTPAYTEMSFGMGQNGYPAISMTQHAANKYCQWLSAQTGHFYRLPTEAEWEYACRAGTTTAYSFGDDPAKLGQYAWYYDNANEKYQKVGKKKPNPWGLFDMHGNVMEWTADAFVPDYFGKLKAMEAASNPFLKPETLYPRSVRGGGWDDDAENLRSSARRGSDESWKQRDPQLPKSIWYHTDAPWVGFRIVRPLKMPTVEELDHFWNSAVNK